MNDTRHFMIGRTAHVLRRKSGRQSSFALSLGLQPNELIQLFFTTRYTLIFSADETFKLFVDQVYPLDLG